MEVKMNNRKIISDADKKAYLRGILGKDIQKLFGRDNRNMRIGIWGTAGSGKTTYLVRLYDALMASKYWTVRVSDNGRDFVQDNQDLIINHGKFPAKTAITSKTRIFNYTITPQKKGLSQGIHVSQIQLDFIDAPGEFYEDFKKYGKDYDIVDYLLYCDGIIFLIDPARKSGEKLSTMIPKLFRELSARVEEKSKNSDAPKRKKDLSGRLEQYMAFCVTKIDRSDYWDKRDDAEKLMLNIAKPRFFYALGNYCYYDDNPNKRKDYGINNRCDFFCVSSIGRHFDGDNYNEIVSEEIISNEIVSKKTTDDEPLSEETPDNQWLEEDFDFETSAEEEIKSEQESLKTIPRIDTKVIEDVVGYGVIEPLEWLIRRIQYKPPTIFR